jgi:cyclase
MRIIARLDIKNQHLIKVIQYEGLRKLGDPKDFAMKYYNAGISELLYLDAVASLYDRSYLVSLIKQTVKDIFIPITVGGGIKNVDDVNNMLRAGADKVAVNTAAVKNPSLIQGISEKFGSQCFVLQLDAKRTDIGYEVFIEAGREPTGILAKNWICEAQNLGCGEVLLTSIDRDGTRKGFDIDLLTEIAPLCKVPLIVSGGIWSKEQFNILARNHQVNAIAIASALHYGNFCFSDLLFNMEKRIAY